MEDFGDLISRGFGIWRNNLNLGLPFLLSFALSMLALVPLIAAAIFYLGPLESLETIPQEEMLSRVEGSLPVLAAAFLLSFLLLSLIAAFFSAGAIGMDRQALESGRSTVEAMWDAGRKHFLNLLLATFLTSLITMAGAVFMLPGLAQLPQPLQPEPTAIGWLLIGMVLFILYALAMSLLLAVVPYALVVEGTGPFKSIRSSISFFSYHKLDVFVLWLVVAAISLGLQMIGGAVSSGNDTAVQPVSALTGLVNLLVLAPLSTVWWTRLYLSRTGKLTENEDWPGG